MEKELYWDREVVAEGDVEQKMRADRKRFYEGKIAEFEGWIREAGEIRNKIGIVEYSGTMKEAEELKNKLAALEVRIKNSEADMQDYKIHLKSMEGK